MLVKIKDVLFWILMCIFAMVFVWVFTGPDCLNGILRSDDLRPNKCPVTLGVLL